MYLLKSRSLARTIPGKNGYDMKTEAITNTVKKNISPNSSKQDGLGGGMGTPSGRKRGSSGDFMSIVQPIPTLNTVPTL